MSIKKSLFILNYSNLDFKETGIISFKTLKFQLLRHV